MSVMETASGLTSSSSRRTSVMRLTTRRFCSTVRPVSIVICTCGMVASKVISPRRTQRARSVSLNFRALSVFRGELLLSRGKVLLREFVSREEVADLEARGVFGIGAVHRVLLDVRSPLLADSALVCLRRIGRAHQLAIVGDSVFFLQRHDDDRPAGHEVGQRLEEGPINVYRVEALGLML